jgi:extradiol dioxygenase family protein
VTAQPQSQLRELWSDSCTRLNRRLVGLTDAEFRWEPCDGCWSVRPDPSAPGRWIMDYPNEVPSPPPVTTIAWRLLHLAHGNRIYWEHAFGPGQLNYPQLPVHATAGAAVADLLASQRLVAQALDTATGEDLDRPVGTPFGDAWPAGRVLRTLVTEQVHHGAEIGLLRDLYPRLAPGTTRPRFHLAIPVDDLAAARLFYGEVLGCRPGRSSARWVDWDLLGHQLVTHLAPRSPHDPAEAANPVDGHDVPVPHFGLLLGIAAFHELAGRLRAASGGFVIEPYLRFAGEPGEQWTMFVRDPAGNALEFKAFADETQIFATARPG